MAIAIYPGSFDPITFGHMDIAVRAASIFDKVYVAVVYTKQSKSFWFTTEQRQRLCTEALAHVPNIEVVSFTGLAVDLAHEMDARILVRGLRMSSDFDYELEMSLNNQKLASDVDTIYLMASLEHIFIKSSLLREIADSNGKVGHIVPDNVAAALSELLRSRV